ncbi:branched-chain amino acid ABC transporter permease [Rhodococcus qingshengii]|uniref:Branched-chain amino acid ABC transporter permease n=3 Tax=Rhodococcus erythropolis group TaxID=2840174 RepID=A0A1Q4K1Y6_RHOER|nr:MULTISPECIES: branched-chain amino acid ABC transporter permease [Rhodococcus]EEN90140.1 branched-chain amino acid ABC transporter, permease protein [Rhodococcus erythropolis SK121]ANQ69871.1 ABC transporter permease [Rhodococcus sp. 008]ARE35574.1 ABC transporter permease [Rhodococcus sp. BH4]AUS33607.1 branched-chain amino acid ABC transporter permease [Rhodococcus qingshengii]AZI63585.1 branched-chain amino acid ABC transporter permease [Rhodococcus sp. NJ-530]
MTLFLERLISGLTNGSIYAILALALVVVFRATGTINFAQGELALFTTFVAWWLTTMSWPIWAAIGAALALGFLLGALMERLLIRPVQRRSDMAVLIVALGLFTGLNSLAGMLWGSETKIMPSPFPNGPTDYISVGGARVYGDALGVLVALVVLLVLMSLLFRKTRVGLHMRAVADNAESATLAGVPTSRILAIGWGVAAAIGALAGVLVTPLSPQQLGLTTMFPIFIAASAAALFGGLDSLVGAVVGGLTIGVLESMLSGYISVIGGSLQQTSALLIIVVILFVRPNGLFGTKKLERV